MMARCILTIATALTATTNICAFAPSLPSRATTRASCTQPLMAVVDVNNESEFDSKISSAGDKLVVIDYSTTWCGPCKVIAPKFDELSDKYTDTLFIKVRGLVSCFRKPGQRWRLIALLLILR